MCRDQDLISETYGRTEVRTYGRTYENWKACSRPAPLGSGKKIFLSKNCCLTSTFCSIVLLILRLTFKGMGVASWYVCQKLRILLYAFIIFAIFKKNFFIFWNCWSVPSVHNFFDIYSFYTEVGKLMSQNCLCVGPIILNKLSIFYLGIFCSNKL